MSNIQKILYLSSDRSVHERTQQFPYSTLFKDLRSGKVCLQLCPFPHYNHFKSAQYKLVKEYCCITNWLGERGKKRSFSGGPNRPKQTHRNRRCQGNSGLLTGKLKYQNFVRHVWISDAQYIQMSDIHWICIMHLFFRRETAVCAHISQELESYRMTRLQNSLPQ